MAASRTMSPSRASKGGDCTTQTSQADWGRGASQAAMCSSAPPLGGVSPATEQSATRPPLSSNGVALPYLRSLTPEGKWTCPSAVCQLPGSGGKMDPPARRLTRPLLRVRLSPGRQENQHPERPASSSRPHPRAPRGCLRAQAPLPVSSGTARMLRNPRAPCPTRGGTSAAGAGRLSSFPRRVATSSRLAALRLGVRHPLAPRPREASRPPPRPPSFPSPRRPGAAPAPSLRLASPVTWQARGAGAPDLPPARASEGSGGARRQCGANAFLTENPGSQT